MPRSQRKPSGLFALAGVLALALAAVAGCSSQPEPAPTAWVTESPDTSVEKRPAPEPEDIPTWPLTGEPYDGELGPVLSVKIENSPGARPQGGLERADIVWEQLVEGGMTRFVAMFHSDLPETLGPIRSVRPLDAAIAGMDGCGLAFSGGQAEYQARIAATWVTLISHDGGNAGFYRYPNRQGDHRLFGKTEQLLAQVGEPESPPELFSYADEGEDPAAVRSGSEANAVETRFPASKPSWQRSEEHTSELQSRGHLVCRLLLENN